jgi:D-arabinitol 4-dehydrogenase
MVDRITPRPTAAVMDRVAHHFQGGHGLGSDLIGVIARDEAAVMAESYIQWVIEDNFIAGRPPWELVGAEMVKDVQPYEEAKIRILNATHSCIAWAGTLLGLK